MSQTLSVLPLPSTAPLAEVVVESSLLEPQATAPSSVAASAAATAIVRFTLPSWGVISFLEGFSVMARAVLGRFVAGDGLGRFLEGRVRTFVGPLSDRDIEKIEDDELRVPGAERVRPERRRLGGGEQDDVAELGQRGAREAGQRDRGGAPAARLREQLDGLAGLARVRDAERDMAGAGQRGAGQAVVHVGPGPGRHADPVQAELHLLAD